ncbi:MAG TPA: PIG-L deacetylase family protein [Ilumatobacteraceae bacterium]|nr:PIG-L deacetylase family protein [Ilumatobacteraceae bacterium]
MTLAEFPAGWRRATVIVAHPDDIEWGLASAVAAWTAAGRDVSYVLVTSGEAGIDSLAPAAARVAREAEERASGAIVGVSQIEFLGHPDGRVVEDLALRRDLAAAIRRQRPDVVVAQYHGEHWGGRVAGPWNSADHRAVGRATMDAVADAANRWIFPELAEDRWAGTQWIAVPVPPDDATHAVDVGAVGELAIRSLLAHEQYLRGLGVEDPRAYATELLEGSTAAVAPHFDGRAGVAFAATPGPAAPA